MKNRPIKTRLTIYYTAVLAVIVLASCALIYFNSSQFSQARARETPTTPKSRHRSRSRKADSSMVSSVNKSRSL